MPRALLLAVICGCSGEPHAAAATPSSASHVPAVLEAVGAKPRVLALVDLRDARVRAQLAELTPLLGAIAGHSAADCKIALDRLDSVRVAIGEPLKVSAEIDGPIDARSVACVLGDSLFAELTKAGFTIRDRHGGIAIERDLERAPATDRAADLVARCGQHSCVVARLGPAAREIWFGLAYDGTTMHARLSGPGFASASALVAAIDQLKTTTPAFQTLVAHDTGGALVVDVAAASREQLTAAIEAELVDAFPTPTLSAMIPTLVQGDHVLAVKGPLLRPIVAGMPVVFRASNGNTYMKRVVARGGQTVSETVRGIAIDGTPLVTEDIAGEYPYLYDFGSGTPVEHSGKLVREHLPDRSYLTLHRMSASVAFARSTQRGSPGSWTIPSGQVFVLGDNRDDSTDSRYIGPIPEDTIIGRVAAIWFAAHDGVPDWERMGSTVE